MQNANCPFPPTICTRPEQVRLPYDFLEAEPLERAPAPCSLHIFPGKLALIGLNLGPNGIGT